MFYSRTVLNNHFKLNFQIAYQCGEKYALMHKKLRDSSFFKQLRCISTSYKLSTDYKERFGTRIFYEPYKKGSYYNKKPKSKIEYIKQGIPLIKSEVEKWREEMKEKLLADPVIVRPGDTDIIFDFKSEDDLQKWIVTSDSDHQEGNSKASLTLSPAGHGLFSGHTDTTIPKDGKVKYTGYCNMTTVPLRKSFKREICYSWHCYTHLKMRVRGDGRRYLLILNLAGFFDVTWHDVYTYILYTRGGPYWQDVKIPFSKFFLNTRGRVQDKQSAMNLGGVKKFGITCCDFISAPFRLEIDYIATHLDITHTEEFAYEMYKIPVFLI